MEGLKYTPRTVHQMEQEAKRSITTIASDPSMQSVKSLVKHGLNLKDDAQTFDFIEKYFIENNTDLLAVYVEAIEQLQKDGFLPKTLNLEEVKTQMKNPVATNGLENSGV